LNVLNMFEIIVFSKTEIYWNGKKMTNQRVRLKANLLIGVIAAIVIFLIADGVENIYAEVYKSKNVTQNNTQVLEKSDSKKNDEIEKKSKEDKVPQEEKTKGKDNIHAIEEEKKKEKPEVEEGKATEEKAEEKKKTLKVEYKVGLLSVDLQNVDIVEALKKISKIANIEIDIGPGIEGRIEKVQFQNLSWEKAMEKLIDPEGRGIVVEYSEEGARRLKVSKKLDKVVKTLRDKEEHLLLIPKTPKGVKVQLRLVKFAAIDLREGEILKEYKVPKDISVVSSFRTISNQWESYDLDIQFMKAKDDAREIFRKKYGEHLSVIPLYSIEILDKNDVIIEKMPLGYKKVQKIKDLKEELKGYNSEEIFLEREDALKCEISPDGKLWAFYNHTSYWMQPTNSKHGKNSLITQEEPLYPETKVKIADPSGNVLWKDKFGEMVAVRFSPKGDMVAFIPDSRSIIYFKNKNGRLIYTYKGPVRLDNFQFSESGKFSLFTLQDKLTFIDIIAGKSSARTIRRGKDKFKFNEDKGTIILFRNNKRYGEFTIDEFANQ